MTRVMTAALPAGDTPVLVEVVRGDMVESRHRARVAIVDADGRVVRAWGDIEHPIYGRSAIKPLLALPLLESGAADAFGLDDAQIALACASHNGEERHVKTVNEWLARIGLSADDLECGAHYPYDEPTAQAMQARGEKPTRAHNNCSGKHAGFLSTALYLGDPIKDYIQYTHPVQQRLLGILEQMCGLDLGQAPRGIDGCGIPVIGIPLGNTAMAMARLADPGGLPPARAAAARRILRAMAAEPFMVAGSKRFCTGIMEVTGLRALVKTGAEGVYAAALPDLGLGVCIKAEDGAHRASEVVMGQVLRHLGIIDDVQAVHLSHLLTPVVRNWAGTPTGHICPAADCPF